MKIWNQFGSEHSMNLVMIGTFKEASTAEQVKQLLDELALQVQKEPSRPHNSDPQEARFSNEMLDFLMKARLHTLGASELDQFNYDVRVDLEKNAVVLRTDESDVSAFLKLLIERGRASRSLLRA